MFVDHIKIYAKAGDGGNGAVHFRREKYVPKGGPDGGDGGKGGDFIIEVDQHTDHLQDFFFRHKWIAKNGAKGGAKRSSGKSAEKLVAKTPAGSLIFRIKEKFTVKTPNELANMQREGIADNAIELVADLKKVGEKFVLCKGGKGGRGNWHFRSPTNQAPIEAEEGKKGEEAYFYIELRKIADVGLVGFPNAGKSTLLRALSAAKPKVASYPFTTLQPNIGALIFEDFARLSIADIPGIIEGAHHGKGLGLEFLRHIWRCRLLLFVIDLGGIDGRSPIDDLVALRSEISHYHEKLAKRPWLALANKIDSESASANLKALRSRFPKIPILTCSALHGDGLAELKAELRDRLF